MNIPNSLSLARICLIPLFVTAYFLPYEWGVYAAIAIFIICCFTDFLDGFIARPDCRQNTCLRSVILRCGD